jgi:hypothetical protein
MCRRKYTPVLKVDLHCICYSSLFLLFSSVPIISFRFFSTPHHLVDVIFNAMQFTYRNLLVGTDQLLGVAAINAMHRRFGRVQ